MVQLWIGNGQCDLTEYDLKTDTFIIYKNDPDNPDSISSNNIKTIYEDSRGTLW